MTIKIDKERKLIEAVQQKATRLAVKFQSILSVRLLTEVDLSSLTYCRARVDMTEVFKYIHAYDTINDDMIKVYGDRT